MTSPALLSGASTASLLEALIAKFENGFSLDETDSTDGLSESLNVEIRRLAALLPRVHIVLARRQNTEPIINRIPSEILAHIFKLASTAEADAHPARRIITLSLVCHHWRQTALGFPALWNTIHLQEGAIHDFQFAALCLERSKEASLSIIISTLFRGEQISNFFSPYSSRIESVSICVPFKCSSHDVPRFLLSTCGFFAPRLKCLRLCTAMWGSYHAPVLPSIFGGDISRITHLHVESFSPFPGHSFGHLTHLALSSQSQYEKRPSMTEFLDLLEANSYLEELLLDDAGPSINTSDSRPPIHLPHMQFLTFVATLTERAVASRVLSHLQLPHLCSIRVHRDMDPSHLDELLPSPFPDDVHHLPTFAIVEKLSLRDDLKAFGEGSVRYSATSRQSGVSTSYRLRGSETHDMWPEAALNSFLHSIPCSQIRVLHLNLRKTASSFHADAWRILFGRLTVLKELYLADMDVSNVVEGMVTLDRDVKDMAILPELVKVCLIRPTTLDINVLLSWNEKHLTHERSINHTLIIVLDGHKMSSLGLEIPVCLPGNVQIYTAGSTFGDVPDHSFEEPEEPLFMTCPPFGRDM
ncbi:hypothetical protein F5148DRAFT_768623 [Russula earlei]|uniref:Uncharacterized protein n=1 Tax=Russula earlei TaxID=71964 RepID=A0ACC0UCL5_9AGAM|nr:hypothetical protein F5148DRAFT_768623 [Russula earlei]